jgi:hypothetical protein
MIVLLNGFFWCLEILKDRAEQSLIVRATAVAASTAMTPSHEVDW